jgi:quinol monooxygenase YgiN
MCRKGIITMLKVGLWVRLETKPDKATEVAAFLQTAVEHANQEPGTPLWCAVQLATTTFAIFDANPDDAGRQAHLAGQIAATIVGNADEWLTQPPHVEPFDILAVKLPR